MLLSFLLNALQTIKPLNRPKVLYFAEIQNPADNKASVFLGIQFLWIDIPKQHHW